MSAQFCVDDSWTIASLGCAHWTCGIFTIVSCDEGILRCTTCSSRLLYCSVGKGASVFNSCH